MEICKRIIGVILCWVFCSFAVLAQAQGEQSDRFARIEKEKKAYITKHLDLSASEATIFFPLYDQYRSELTMLQRERRQVKSREEQRDSRQPLRNDRFERGLVSTDRDMLAFDAKRLELKKDYRKRFADAIGQARASQFFQVEEEFNEYLMRHLQNRRRQRDNP